MKHTRLIFCFLLITIGKISIAQPNKEIDEKLSIISSLSVNNNGIDLPEDSVLRKYLKIEVIDEVAFYAKQKTAINYLLADTLKIRKKKGILRLPLATGTKTLKDIMVDDEGHTEYEYLGQISFLNAYLVRCMLWEEMDYQIISKKNGATIGNFAAMPIISGDKKMIVAAYANPYETDSEIALSTITGTKITNKLFAVFPHWMPGPEDKMFWGSDRKLYLPIQLSGEFWNADGNVNTDYRYIRITIL